MRDSFATRRPGASLKLTIALLALALTSPVLAETIFESPDFRFSVAIPSGWAQHEEFDVDGGLTVLIGSPDGAVALILGAGSLDATFDAEERAAYERDGLDGVLDVIVGALLGSLPEMQVTDRQQRQVAGFDARRVAFASPELAGSLLTFVDGDVLFLLASMGEVSASERAEHAQERMVASFTRFADAGQTAENPLLPSDALTGRYHGERFDLVLEGGGGRYTGYVTFGDQRFEVFARGSAEGLEGSFESVDGSFSFTAALDGDTLTFVTDGVEFTLRR